MSVLPLLQSSGGVMPSGLWSALGNAAADLTLANAGFNTTFNQTSAVNWMWANTTVATSVGVLPAIVQGPLLSHQEGGGSTASPSVDTTGATLLVAFLSGFGGAPTISDSKSNSWNYLPTYSDSGPQDIRIAYVFGPTVGVGHTFTFSVSGQYGWANVYAVSGTLTTSAVYDTPQQNGATSVTSPFATGGVTPSPGDFVFTGFGAAANTNQVTSIDTGFHTPDTVGSTGTGYQAGATSYLLSASGTTINPTWTTTATGAKRVAIACFKAAPQAVTNQPSPIIKVSGTVYDATGPSSITDTWNIQNIPANLLDGQSTLTFTHSGSTGVAAVQVRDTTVATSITTNASPLLEVAANYWTGAASAQDLWTIGSSLAAGTNGASTLTIGHSGSTVHTQVFAVDNLGAMYLAKAAAGAPTSVGTAGTIGQIIRYGGVLYFCSVTGAAGSATWNSLNMTAV